jgi:hypothetical protein
MAEAWFRLDSSYTTVVLSSPPMHDTLPAPNSTYSQNPPLLELVPASPEPAWSTAGRLLRHAGKWVGDDLEEGRDLADATPPKAEFHIEVDEDGRWTKSFAELAADLIWDEDGPPDLSYNKDYMRDYGR